MVLRMSRLLMSKTHNAQEELQAEKKKFEQFDGAPKNHIELCEKLKLIDFARGLAVESRMLAGVRVLKAAGIDCVNVPDGPRAQMRMGVLPTATLVEQIVGIETVVHYCCRDRNLLGMLSDLLGAHALGLRNLLGRQLVVDRILQRGDSHAERTCRFLVGRYPDADRLRD